MLDMGDIILDGSGRQNSLATHVTSVPGNEICKNSISHPTISDGISCFSIYMYAKESLKQAQVITKPDIYMVVHDNFVDLYILYRTV